MTENTSPSPVDPRRRPYLIAGTVVAIATLFAGILTIAVIQRWRDQENGPEIDGGDASGSNVTSPLNVNLYYIAENGLGLVEQEFNLTYDGDNLSRARAIIERQLAEAPTPLVSPFPEGTTLLAFYMDDDGNAFVDLSLDVTTRHSGGSLDELFTVYSLVNALTINVPEISAVQIIIDGSEVDTLAGHVDLRQPLGLNMNWVIDPNAIPNDNSKDLGVNPSQIDNLAPPPANSRQ